LPTLATAEATPITVLTGFPTTLAKNADATTIYPFGIWFANANTLYVGDEGDGVAADAATSTKAGLQKWSLVSGTWQLDYVLQKGLNLGTPYSVPNYPASLNPATDGLRNITGKVNADGTATIWGGHVHCQLEWRPGRRSEQAGHDYGCSRQYYRVRFG